MLLLCLVLIVCICEFRGNWSLFLIIIIIVLSSIEQSPAVSRHYHGIAWVTKKNWTAGSAVEIRR